jgi:hypothetical protein
MVREIVDAQKDGMFMVLTEGQVEAFSDADQCEEYVATLGSQQFAVVRLLWASGTARNDRNESFDRDDMQRRRLEADAQAHASMFNKPGPEPEK